MEKTEQIGRLVADCLDRCRTSGYTLATLIGYLDEMRASGSLETDVQWVDTVMRHILKNVLVPSDSLPVDLRELPTKADGGKDTKIVENIPD